MGQSELCEAQISRQNALKELSETSSDMKLNLKSDQNMKDYDQVSQKNDYNVSKASQKIDISSDNDASMVIERDDLSDDEIAEIVPKNTKVYVQKGTRFAMESIKIDEAVPNTRQFRVFKY